MSNQQETHRIDYVEFPAPSAEKLRAAHQFYSTVFGWKFQEWGPDYVDTKDSGIGSGLNADPSHRPPAPLAVIYATGLEVAATMVTHAGGKIVKPIFSFPGGRRFEFVDPAGNRLAVWSDQPA